MCAALGGRVKYLVDTPEIIWGCLDAREFLAAARRAAVRLPCACRAHVWSPAAPHRPPVPPCRPPLAQR